MDVFTTNKLLLVGRPLRTGRLGETLLSKRLALPVFCSDPLSSNAYATEEILRALSLGGLALLLLTPWVALAVVVLLTVVAVTYRQTCYAYPNGRGAYAVSRVNLGRNAAHVAASALLVDYVVTVAVSVAAGVDAITLAFLSLQPHSVGLSLLFIGVLALMNLRGVKESGTVFAIPRYGFFIAVIFGMIGWSFWRMLTGEIIGVFVSFTLSQAGMVRRWITRLRSAAPKARYRLRRARLINAGGALLTGLVLVVVSSTKFTHGAYLVVIAMAVLFALMKAVERRYRHVGEELTLGPGGISMPSRIDAVVLVSRPDQPTLQALAYAKATQPDTLTALTVATGEAEIQQLEGEWAERDILIPLTVVDAPYRDITGPVLQHVLQPRSTNPRSLVVVYIPEYLVGRPWEQLLHFQSALRLKARLLFQRGVLVTSVPWQLRSGQNAEQRAVRPELMSSGTAS